MHEVKLYKGIMKIFECTVDKTNESSKSYAHNSERPDYRKINVTISNK